MNPTTSHTHGHTEGILGNFLGFLSVWDFWNPTWLQLRGKVRRLQYLFVLDGVPDVVGVILESIPGLDLFLVLLVLRLVPFGLLYHPLDLLLGEATLVIGDRDFVLDACNKDP